jgi:hypothetical protein
MESYFLSGGCGSCHRWSNWLRLTHNVVRGSLSVKPYCGFLPKLEARHRCGN